MRVQCKLNANLLGINTEKIIVAGSSAGGNLVSELTSHKLPHTGDPPRC